MKSTYFYFKVIIMLVVLSFIGSCTKELEKDSLSSTMSDNAPSCMIQLSEDEASVIVQKIEQMKPSDIEGRQSNNNLKSGDAGNGKGTQPQPAVTFTYSWNGSLYNCESAHNGVTGAVPTLPGCDWDLPYYFTGTDYLFQLLSSSSSSGPWTVTNLSGWQEDDNNISFTIPNPPSPGKYYKVRCSWYNIYAQVYCNPMFITDPASPYVYYVDSSVKYLIYHAPPPPVFSVYISGPVKGYENVYYTWQAHPVNGTNPITYLWYRSNDGGQTYPYSWGTGQSRTAQLPLGQDLYIKVVATAANGTAQAEFETMNMGPQ